MNNQDESLSALARSLSSDYDRKRYIKVIEMSNTIRSKLAELQEEKKRSSVDTLKSKTTLVNEHTSVWSFSDILHSSSQSIASSDTIATTTSRDDVVKPYLDETIYMSGRVVDHATSLKLRSEFMKRKPIVTLKSAPNDTTTNNKQRLSYDSTSSSEDEFPSTIHIAVRKDASLYKIEKKKTVQEQLAGLWTPPDSPQIMSNLEIMTRITPIYKKTSSLLRKSCQLNQYTMMKTNSASPLTLPLLFYKTTNSTDGASKYMLKITIVSLDSSTPELQRRFGFTFSAVHHHRAIPEEAKFALAPDSLVKEALTTWIDNQKGGLPCLSKSDEILRDGRKIYVIYNTNLFI